MSEGSLVVISGPSGAGKGTLVNRIAERLSGVWVSVSATTRPPREGEQDGVSYFFMTPQHFEKTVDEGGFVEWAKVHSNYYGTPVAPIRQHMDKGETVLLEIDVQGGFQVRDKFPDAKLIFIAPPSEEVLEQRLRGRATDSEEVIVQRLENAKGEMAAAADYDIVIVNDDLMKATNELLEVLQS